MFGISLRGLKNRRRPGEDERIVATTSILNVTADALALSPEGALCNLLFEVKPGHAATVVFPLLGLMLDACSPRYHLPSVLRD